MKKCKGCGALLQNEYPNLPGYVLNLDQDYCKRCFRLTHYGDTSSLADEIISNDLIIKEYQRYKNDLFVLIVDSFDALNLNNDDLLDCFDDYKVLLVINKIDLLPYSVKDDKMEDLFKKVINKCNKKNIIGCLLTYKNDDSFNSLFFEVLNDLKVKNIVFAGRVNAGKSTIINKLRKTKDLTVSSYPGTTISSNEIEVNGMTFVDTPGLIDNSSFISLLNKTLVKELIPNKCVKPIVFQVKDNESYSVEGLIDIDVKPSKDSSIIFLINNNLEIHRSKFENIDNFIDRHFSEYKLNLLPIIKTDFDVQSYKTFYIKGLGFIKIKSKSNITIRVNKNIKIYSVEVNL